MYIGGSQDLFSDSMIEEQNRLRGGRLDERAHEFSSGFHEEPSTFFQDGEGEGDWEQFKSESVCLRELEMALLAENVFCNGLSTLITNLTLRFAPTPDHCDRPWLKEYKLGAQCCIFPFVIPGEFDGYLLRDVLGILSDYGVIPFAVLTEGAWQIINLELQLEGRMSTMVITYHRRESLERIIDSAIERLQMAQSEREFEHSGESDVILVGENAADLDGDEGLDFGVGEGRLIFDDFRGNENPILGECNDVENLLDSAALP